MQPTLDKHANSGIVPRLLRWFGANARDLPWRRTCDPYAIWISEIMLQQTQVVTVLPYYERWMRALPSISAVAKAKEITLLKLWEGLGYYTRVRNIQKAARQIMATHDGEFPRDHQQILSLPGIGPYTAGAISSIAFDQPAPLVDGNVVRVLARLFGIAANPKDKAGSKEFWSAATKLVCEADNLRDAAEIPERPCSSLNQALMELGAMVCLPRKPRCERCPVAADCFALRTGRIDQLPQAATRPEISHRQFVAFVFRKGSRLLVRQRAGNVVNGRLWEFPNMEVKNRSKPEELLAFRIGEKARELVKFTHSITRYRNTVAVLGTRLKTGEAAAAQRQFGGKWLGKSQIEKLPFSSAHRRILSYA